MRRKGKWGLSKSDFPPNVFPPYESGSAYIQTMDLTEELYETAMYIKPIFIDDVFITGVVAKLISNIHRELQPGFAYGTDRKPELCDIVLNKKFAQTKCPPGVLQSLWLGLSDPILTQCPGDKAKKIQKVAPNALAKIQNQTIDKTLDKIQNNKSIDNLQPAVLGGIHSKNLTMLQSHDTQIQELVLDGTSNNTKTMDASNQQPVIQTNDRNKQSGLDIKQRNGNDNT